MLPYSFAPVKGFYPELYTFRHRVYVIPVTALNAFQIGILSEDTEKVIFVLRTGRLYSHSACVHSS